MSDYKHHARKKGTTLPLCGSAGAMGGFHVTTVSAETWNNTKPELRCARCVAAIKRMKQRA
ncbi:hypothetical protein [Burkholderia stagnalis]|uniref:hypothetical protein n=1 Tax=Burkholderia stagnalis TaxID=1503054 RepID=UPI00163A640C|nr:hypothetical protein [Burkholderia stagnalis]